MIDGDSKLVYAEIRQAVEESVPAERVPEAMQQLRALLGRVMRCEAIDPDDVQNIARNRELWELRLEDHAFGVHVRIYITEHKSLPAELVALHAHAKITVGTDDEIRRLQDEAIDLASDRWFRGLPNLWGLGHSPAGY